MKKKNRHLCLTALVQCSLWGTLQITNSNNWWCSGRNQHPCDNMPIVASLTTAFVDMKSWSCCKS